MPPSILKGDTAPCIRARPQPDPTGADPTRANPTQDRAAMRLVHRNAVRALMINVELEPPLRTIIIFPGQARGDTGRVGPRVSRNTRHTDIRSSTPVSGEHSMFRHVA